jgi:hypothetical protein
MLSGMAMPMAGPAYRSRTVIAPRQAVLHAPARRHVSRLHRGCRLSHPRGLDRALFQKLAEGKWIEEHANLLICGPTGIGKSWVGSALGHKACRDNRSAEDSSTAQLHSVTFAINQPQVPQLTLYFAFPPLSLRTSFSASSAHWSHAFAISSNVALCSGFMFFDSRLQSSAYPLNFKTSFIGHLIEFH